MGLEKVIFTNNVEHRRKTQYLFEDDWNKNNSLIIGRRVYNGTYEYSSYLRFTIPTGLTFSNSNRLVFAFKRSGPDDTDQKFGSSIGQLTSITEGASFGTVQGDYYTTDEGTTQASGSTSKNVWYYLVFKTNKIKQGHQYEISLPYASDALLYWYGSGTGNMQAYLYYDSYTSPSKPTLTFDDNSTNKNIERNGSVTLKINAPNDGNNNPIKIQRIFYNTKNSVDTSKYFDLSAGTTSATIKNSELGNLNKGQKIYLFCQSIGTASGFNSEYSSSISYSIINSLPSAPVFTVTGIIRGDGTTTSIKINKISSTDINEDSLKYYYKITSSSSVSASSSGWTEITSSGGTVNMTKTNCYIAIKTNDGTADSAVTTTKVSINTLPVISQISYSGQSIIILGSDPTKYATRLLSASATINKTELTYEWSIKTTTSSYTKISSDKTFTNLNIQGKGKDYEIISIQLKVTDLIGDSAIFEQVTNQYLLPSLGSITINSITNVGALGAVNAEYFGNQIKINFTLPQAKNGRVNLSKCEIYAGDLKILTINSGLTYGSTVEKNIDTSALDFGKSYIFKIYVYDVSDQYVSISSSTFKKLELITLPKEGSYSITPTGNYNIYNSTSSFSVSSFYKQLESGKGEIYYYIQYQKVGENWRDLLNFTMTSGGSSAGESTINYAASFNEDFFRKFGLATNYLYNINYRIIAKNVFGLYNDNSIKYLNDYSIDTRAKPEFKETEAYVRYGYLVDGVKQYGSLISNQTSNNYRYFHEGEYLNFCITKHAEDANKKIINGNTTSSDREPDDYLATYRFEYSYNNKEWFNLSVCSPQISKVGDYYSYDVQITNNIFEGNNLTVYFRVIAIDDTGLESEPLNIASYMIFSRKENPILEVKTATLSGDQIQVETSISDYGGNNKGLVNFNRTGTEKAKIKIEYGDTPSLGENFEQSDILLTNLGDNLTKNINKLTASKIYIKVTITIYTNPSNEEYCKIENSTPIYIFYFEGPTVSYRQHWVGINNTDNNSEDVIQISNFQNKRYIRLVGDKEGIKTTLLIDLEEGKINGIKFLETGAIDNSIINGGTW